MCSGRGNEIGEHLANVRHYITLTFHTENCPTICLSPTTIENIFWGGGGHDATYITKRAGTQGKYVSGPVSPTYEQTCKAVHTSRQLTSTGNLTSIQRNKF